VGEGWHNYHHVFPWDYKAAELGNYSVNLTTGFIDLFAKIGKVMFLFIQLKYNILRILVDFSRYLKISIAKQNRKWPVLIRVLLTLTSMYV